MAEHPQVAFLGPLGTFTEQALLTQADLAGGELVPLPSIPEVLDAFAMEPSIWASSPSRTRSRAP